MVLIFFTNQTNDHCNLNFNYTQMIKGLIQLTWLVKAVKQSAWPSFIYRLNLLCMGVSPFFDAARLVLAHGLTLFLGFVPLQP